MLASLLAGVSSGLRTAEKVTVWLHVWVYFIHVFLQLHRYHNSGPWLPYLWALIQGAYLLFEAQNACKAQGQQEPRDHSVVRPTEEDGNPCCACVDCFVVLKQHCAINLKLGAFNFV